MLREAINDMRNRWGPKERRGPLYDPTHFVDSPDQARKLLKHLQKELSKARREKNKELIAELEEILGRVENLSKIFFRWEQNMERSVKSQELQEIKKLPLGL